MSTKTSHRRAHGRHRRNAARAGIVIANLSHAPVRVEARICQGRCRSQCDECHDIDNCVEGTERYGDLLLCQQCRGKHPKVQPWRICPETGEYIDAVTGRYL